MKNLFFTILIGVGVVPAWSISAQQTPVFQFSLYFEDAVGNRDSLILGYDPSASFNNLNPQFGESPLLNPFDSVFEVRASHGFDTQMVTSKKIIENMVGGTPQYPCIASAHSIIIINAKYPPVKITYDSTLFPVDPCKNIILSPHWNIFTIEHWWNACDIFCLGSASEYLEDFIIPEPMWDCWNNLYIEKEVEGQGIKTLPGIFFSTKHGPGPCNDPTFLSTTPHEDSDGNASIYPNPTTGYFSVSIRPSEAVQVELRDMAGHLVPCSFERSGDAIEFDGRHLAAGLYGVVLRGKHGKTTSVKVVKL